MFNILKSLFGYKNSASNDDAEVVHYQNLFKDKILVEELVTKIHRHHIFWVGRSEFDDNEIRLGIEFANGTRTFTNISGLQNYYGEFHLMTPEQALALEKELPDKQAKAKADKKAQKNAS